LTGIPSHRDPTVNGLVLASSFAAAVALGLSLVNQWLWFGILVWLILFFFAAIGYGPHSRRGTILSTLTGMFLLYSGFLIGIVWTFDPSAEPPLFFGLPVPTAFLVYGIWPCGVILGLLYGVEFRRSVLPEDRLRQFLAEFGRKE
jgi:hypothetical protein